MKFFDIWCAILILFVVLLIIQIDTAEARKRPKKAKAGVCKYDRKGEEGPCDTATNTKVVTLLLKKGDATSCPANKTVSKPCTENSKPKRKMAGCKYERKGSAWSDCDATTNSKSKDMKLKEGSNLECPAVHTKTKSCGNKKEKKKANRGARKNA